MRLFQNTTQVFLGEERSSGRVDDRNRVCAHVRLRFEKCIRKNDIVQ